MATSSYLRSSGIWNINYGDHTSVIPVGFGVGKVTRLRSGIATNVYIEFQRAVHHTGTGSPIGNLVILAVHYVTGRFGELGPLLSVPVFVAVLGFVALTFGASERPRTPGQNLQSQSRFTGGRQSWRILSWATCTALLGE